MTPLWDRALRLGQSIVSNQTEEPIGVLDIGSNSVRLVVYERLSRSLTPLYNEKSSCMLGRGVAETGRLADDNVAMAFSAFERFARVATALGVKDVHAIATSAVREAENGAAFMARLAEIMGREGRVLSGEDEAHFAALGVVSGMPGFAGIVGDLGGGSLELATIQDGHDAKGETLPLGAIRLQDDSGQNPAKAYKLAKSIVKSANVLDAMKDADAGQEFAAIGGTWRALAKVLQHSQNYPLHMVQGYRVSPKDLQKMCETIIEGKLDDALMAEVGSTRRALLPYGAASMLAVLERGHFENVVFSAMGVREGYLFGQLSDAQKAQHPLLESVAQFNAIRSRNPAVAVELIEFTRRIIEAAHLIETENETMLREAACYMSDIGWRGHPDYRGEQSVGLVAYSAMAGVEHAGRAFLAEVLAVRYLGLKHESESQNLVTLLGEAATSRARAIGAMLRLAYTACSAVEGILPEINVVRQDDGIALEFPNSKSLFDPSRMETRVKHLSATLNQSVSFSIY